MEALKAEGVCRKYADVTVLKDFSLRLQPGGFEALMGPSGSGKSTFLHLAAGLLGVDSGEIAIGGENIVDMSDAAVTRFRRRRIGFVFQSFNLLNEKTVAENIVLPVRLDGGKIDHGRLEALARLLGIEGSLGKKPECLSGGEQQRVAIARALFAAPDVILADEPTGNLDAGSTKTICALLREVNRTENSAILVVTHDPQVAAAADKVHFLKDGRIASSDETGGDPALVSSLYLETYK